MEREQFYWDANAFLGFLNDEADKAEICQHVLQAADNGTAIILTSAFTLAEVIYIKGQPKLDPSKRARVDLFFKADYISVRDVTRLTSVLARDLVWDYNIRPQDAIHVATACLYKVPVLHTFDQKLLDRDGMTLAGHTLKICKPAIIHQTDWVDENKTPPEQE